MISESRKRFSVEELNLNDNYTEKQLYPRKIYGVVLTYCSLANPNQANYAHLYITDFTSSCDIFDDIALQDRFTMGNGQYLGSDRILTIDLRKRDLQTFLDSVSRQLRVELPTPQLNPYDQIYQYKLIVDISGMLSRYRTKLEFKWAKVKLLSYTDIQDVISSDKYMKGLIKRMNSELCGDQSIRNVLEERYRIGELLGKRVKKLPTGRNIGLVQNPALIQREPEYNDSTKRILEILHQGRLQGGEVPLSQVVKDDEVDEPSLFPKLEDDSGEFKGLQECATSVCTRSSAVRSTSFDRIYEDENLSGEFEVRDVKVLGFIPEGESLIMIIGPNEDSNVNGSGLIKRYIKVEFADSPSIDEFLGTDGDTNKACDTVRTINITRLTGTNRWIYK